jgi:hypothetical protein
MEYLIGDYRKLRTEMRRRTKVTRELHLAVPGAALSRMCNPV